MNSPVRILIAEAQAIALHGLAAIVEQGADFRVVARTNEGDACLRLIEEAGADVAMVATSLPHPSGWEVLTRVIDKKLPIRIILLGSGKQGEEVLAMKLGASAYLSCNADPAMIHNCLANVRDGRRWLHSLSSRLERVSRSRRPQVRSGFLTSREREVAALAAGGLSNKAIARRLELSDGTVRIHLHNIFRKLDVANRTELAARTYGIARSGQR